jgi:hypothetical protein
VTSAFGLSRIGDCDQSKARLTVYQSETFLLIPFILSYDSFVQSQALDDTSIRTDVVTYL